MKHEMRLDRLQFEEICSDLKKVEVRLNDEKRQKLRVGDIIKFYKRPECIEEIEVKVLELHHYQTITELVNATPTEYFGPRFKDKNELINASWHYSPEEIRKYGLLAIHLETQ